MTIESFPVPFGYDNNDSSFLKKQLNREVKAFAINENTAVISIAVEIGYPLIRISQHKEVIQISGTAELRALKESIEHALKTLDSSSNSQ